MQVPIASSIAGTVGLSNSRDAKLNAMGSSGSVSVANTATKPLEENANVGDRDAQEKYMSDPTNARQDHNQQSPSEAHEPTMLDLPAQDDDHSTLDLRG